MCLQTHILPLTSSPKTAAMLPFKHRVLWICCQKLALDFPWTWLQPDRLQSWDYSKAKTNNKQQTNEQQQQKKNTRWHCPFIHISPICFFLSFSSLSFLSFFFLLFGKVMTRIKSISAKYIVILTEHRVALDAQCIELSFVQKQAKKIYREALSLLF